MSQTELTERELKVVSAVGKGYSDKEIAELLKMGEATVKKILGKVCEKWDISTRLGLAALAIEQTHDVADPLSIEEKIDMYVAQARRREHP